MPKKKKSKMKPGKKRFVSQGLDDFKITQPKKNRKGR